MRQVWSIAAKELRGYFNSAVALLFLATFLFTVMLTFFFVDKFFARNVADVGPLFRWLPILLIFLVAALTMRLWSEEHKTGTIEVLLTLPVPIHRLVIGKFLAGFVLVAIALLLTTGLPITVSMMGNLDWGPVVGGYVGALLLAGAYLAIGLCISAATENQIVALIATMLVGALFYLPGVPLVADLFGVGGSEILRLIGTGSRFESIARGVLDLRDLAYYAALMVLFLTLNTVLLQARRWSNSQRTLASRRNTRLAVALVALNAVAANFWLQPVTAARLDLTEDGMYSLSEPTENLLGSLEEPLVLRGYFSQERTHPLLMPLVPQVRNLLAEYEIAGGDRVQVEIFDPNTDEEIEKEIDEKYGIRPVPASFSDRHETAVVDTYFQVLVAYGDQHEVINLISLLRDSGDGAAYFDNLEYEITKAIRKVVYSFQSIEALFASMPGQLQLTAYVTPDTLPEQWKDTPKVIEIVAGELEEQSGGKLTYQQVAPSTPEQRKQLFETYAVAPIQTRDSQPFYLELLLELDDRAQKISIVDKSTDKPTEESLRASLRSAIRRLAPGFLTVVGLVTPKPIQENPPMPGMESPPPRPVQGFDLLRQVLSANYRVRSVDLDTGTVPDSIDVLLVAGPDDIGDDAQLAIDQFLMRGGAVVLLVGEYRLDLEEAAKSVLVMENVRTNLDTLLERYGVKVGDQLVLEPKENEPLAIPGERQQVQLMREYPHFVRVAGERISDSMMTRNVEALILHWPSPIHLVGDGAADRQVVELLETTDQAWLQADTAILPDPARHPPTGFGPPAQPDPALGKPPYLLAVAITGTFDSAFKKPDEAAAAAGARAPGEDLAAIVAGAAGGTNPAGEAIASTDQAAGATPNGRLLERSPPDARLVVIGSSSFVSDEAMSISQGLSRQVANNVVLVQNVIDWAVADTELLSIRARGSVTRTLDDVDEDERDLWELGNYGIALAGLVLVFVIAHVRRKNRIEVASRIIAPTAQPRSGHESQTTQTTTSQTTQTTETTKTEDKQ
jgi:ABC-2 type transport system permease protein